MTKTAVSRPLSVYRFPVQYLEMVEHFLENRGYSVGDCLDSARLPDAEVLYGEGYLTGEQLLALLQICADVADTSRPLSAQLLDVLPVTAHGTLGIVVLTSPTLAHALAAAMRFYPLVMPAYRIREERCHGKLHLLFEPLVDLGALTPVLTEMVVGAFNSIRRYVSPDFELLEMHFCHHNDYPLDAYASFANPERLRFGQASDQLIMPESHLKLPLITANRTTMQQYEKELESQIQVFGRLNLAHQLLGLARQAIAASRVVSLDTMAAALAVSARTLSRRLSEEGTSFSQLLTTARIEYAEHLLRSTSKNMSQIATAAGFANESSFSRAFRKIKGIPPSEYRQRC